MDTESRQEIRMVRKNHGSKRTAEFAVAAELSRRGYTVAFTQGSHTPDYDLLAASPNVEAFKVDVKGMATKGAWLVQEKREQSRLFYILALVPPGTSGRKGDQFFILTQKEVGELIGRYRREHPSQKDVFSGFGWKDALDHEDKWEKLSHNE